MTAAAALTLSGLPGLEGGSTPTVTISASTATVSENSGVIAFTVVASPAPSEDLTVNLTRSGTATQGDDYSLSGLAGTDPNYTLTVGTSGNALIEGTAQADSVTDDDETIVFTLAEGEGYTLGAETTASVSINDVPPGTVTPTTPSVTISASGTTVSENGVLGHLYGGRLSGAQWGSDGQSRPQRNGNAR